MIKDPLGCLLTGYITRLFDFQAVVLFRHPAGFVSSVMRLGWPIGKFLDDFLTRKDLMADHLSPFAKLIEKHRDRNDLEAATVLHGTLNTVLWNQTQQNPSIRYYLFEDLCNEPIQSFQEMFMDLDLPYTARTRERHQKLCFADTHSNTTYHPHAVVRDSKTMADRWKIQLSKRDIAKVKELWLRFSIPLYVDETTWSTDQD